VASATGPTYVLQSHELYHYTRFDRIGRVVSGAKAGDEPGLVAGAKVGPADSKKVA
jgi:hypothetical protein